VAEMITSFLSKERVTKLDRQWEDHVAIDPDRTYGIDLRFIDVYQLMKFGAYAQDGLNMRIFTSGGSYYDSWIGFLGYVKMALPTAMLDSKPSLIDSKPEIGNEAQADNFFQKNCRAA
jgi:hypothetical protein